MPALGFCREHYNKTTSQPVKLKKESLKIFRISMVTASLSPLFIIWAISGQMTPFQGAYFELDSHKFL